MLKWIHQKLRNSAELFTLLHHSTMALYGVVLLPLLVKNLDAPELSAWFLFGTLSGLALTLEMGFPSVGSRAVQYFYGGAQSFPNNLEEWREVAKSTAETKAEPNWPVIQGLMLSLRRLMQLLSLSCLVFTAGLGYFLIQTPIAEAASPQNLYLSLGLYCAALCINMQYFSMARIIMHGLDKVAELAKLMTMQNLARIVLTAAVLLLGGGIVSVCAVFLAVNAGFSVLAYLQARRALPKAEKRVNGSAGYLKMLWPGCRYTTLASAGTFLRNQGDAIVVSRLPDPALIAGYLLLKRLFSLLNALDSSLVTSRLPLITKWRAQNKLQEIVGFALPRVGLVAMLLSLAMTLLFFLLPYLLIFLGKDSGLELPPWQAYILLALLNLLIALIHSSCMIYNTTNDIKTLTYPSLAAALLTFLLQMLVVDAFGLVGILSVGLLVQLPLLFYTVWWLNHSLEINALVWVKKLFSPHLCFPTLLDRIFPSRTTSSRK